MSATEKALRKQKRTRTGLLKSIGSVIQAGKAALEQVNYDELAVKEAVLTEYKQELKAINDTILDLVEESEEEQEVEQAQQWVKELMGTINTWRNVILRQVGSSGVGLPHDNPASHGGQRADQSKDKGESVKLPQLHIEKFFGKPEKWAEFWDSYSSTIHSSKMAKVDKFKYLKHFVGGSAHEVLRGYALTDTNYDTVVEALKERFGHADSAIDAHFKALFSIPQASNNATSLYATFDKCEMHIRSLLALGVDEKEFERVSVGRILEKMPPVIQASVHRSCVGQPLKLNLIRQLIKQEIKIAELVEKSKQSGDASEPPEQGFKKKHAGAGNSNEKTNSNCSSGTVSALVNSTNQGNKKEPKCVFCSENHYASECRKYGDSTSRMQRAQELRLCFKCAVPGHIAFKCRNPKRCFSCKAFGKHHTSLCTAKQANPKQKGVNEVKGTAMVTNSLNPTATAFTPEKETGNAVSSNVASADPGSEAVNTLATMPNPDGQAIMQTAIATIVGQHGKQCKARLMFDTASSKTFATVRIKESVDAKASGSRNLAIGGFQDTERRPGKYAKIEFWVICRNNEQIPIVAHVTPTISCPIQKIPVSLSEFPQLQQYPLAEPMVEKSEMIDVDILVGLDYYYRFVRGEVIDLTEDLLLLESKLGYIVTGIHDGSAEHDSTLLLVSHNSSGSLGGEPDLSRYWELEEIGIKDSASQVDDEEAMRLFLENVEFDGTRYWVTWPWRQPKSLLPSNYKCAYGQLQANVSNLAKQPSVLAHYDKTLRDLEQRGIIEEAPVVDIQDGVGIHYLQHHCVLKPERVTTKLRVVHNASKITRGWKNSLNDCVYPGPVILEDLGGILMRFRLYEIGLVSDIEKAFFQLRLKFPERDVTRFLWVRDTEKPARGKNVLHYRFTSVLFGVTSSPFLLAATIHHHLGKYNSDVASLMKANTYVDNVIAGTANQEEALRYYKEAKNIFNDCSMNLREWHTNDSLVRSELNESDRGKGLKTKVLGLTWNTDTDTLQCPKMSERSGKGSLTKRAAAEMLGRLYDPCGFFTPVSVTGKRLMQESWQLGLNWDDPLPETIVRQWENFFDEILKVSSVVIPRLLGEDLFGPNTKLQLHVFCDASKDAYDAAVYLRSDKKGKVNVNLMFAKGRIKPLKSMTIPRLELMGVLTGVRLCSYVERQLRLPIAQKFLWSDSMCVLQWIPKKQIMPVFIENRLREIRTHSDLRFLFINSEKNPADLGTRGCQCEFIKNSSLWWHGPEFLSKPESEWPENRTAADAAYQLPDSPCMDHCEGYVVGVANEDSVSKGVGEVMDITRFSSLSKLLRVTAWVRRIFHKNTRSKRTPSGHELHQALHLWIHQSQVEHFSNLLGGKKQPIIQQLNAYVDDTGVVRCRGRLENSELAEAANNPILLPKNDPLARLIVNDAHLRLNHAKIAHTLAQVRERYWIVQGRSTVKSVIKQCRVCKRKDNQPFQIPPQPPLPKFRVERCQPFQRVGIDYMGPLYVKKSNHDQVTQKVWVSLFTCAVIRAVHLEVVVDLTAEQFVFSLRRFVARYGRPELIVSDNATNFSLTDKTLKAWWQELLEDDRTQKWAAENFIEWKFVTEMAPWMGGMYERLIGVVKNALIRTLGRSKLTLIELQTVLAEIEATVNTRPLVSSESDTMEPYLSPAHFLAPRMKEIIPATEVKDPEYGNQPTEAQAKLLLSYRRLQSLLDSFWKLWQSQYLLSLREKWAEQRQYRPSSQKPVEGMVVLLKEDNVPRSQWRLGRILTLDTSFDGQIRSATVKTGDGKLHRPLKLLIPLEYDVCSSTTEEPIEESSTEPVREQQILRPRREAAIAARQKVKQNLRAMEESQ